MRILFRRVKASSTWVLRSAVNPAALLNEVSTSTGVQPSPSCLILFIYLFIYLFRYSEYTIPMYLPTVYQSVL